VDLYWKSIKNIFFSSILFLLLLSSCTIDESYVRTPGPGTRPKSVALPSAEKGKPLEYYEVYGERYYPLSDSDGFIQYGKASWYGPEFHGRPTSSGQVFDMYKKTAAHKILPLSTMVKVTNLCNQKSVVVPINYRGPFVKGREIDLSYAAAAEIGLIDAGVADVQIIALGKEVGRIESEGRTKPLVEVRDFKIGEFTVQVGAFQSRENALRLAQRMKQHHEYVNVSSYAGEDEKLWYRVHVSKSGTLDQANEVVRKVEKMGFPNAFVVSL
jgi:rare lipoprotein A